MENYQDGWIRSWVARTRKMQITEFPGHGT